MLPVAGKPPSGSFFVSGATIVRYKSETAEGFRFVSLRYIAEQTIHSLFLCKICAVPYYTMTRFERVGGESRERSLGDVCRASRAFCVSSFLESISHDSFFEGAHAILFLLRWKLSGDTWRGSTCSSLSFLQLKMETSKGQIVEGFCKRFCRSPHPFLHFETTSDCFVGSGSRGGGPVRWNYSCICCAAFFRRCVLRCGMMSARLRSACVGDPF